MLIKARACVAPKHPSLGVHFVWIVMLRCWVHYGDPSR